MDLVSLEPINPKNMAFSEKNHVFISVIVVKGHTYIVFYQIEYRNFKYFGHLSYYG